MELVAALLFGPAASLFVRKPLHGWIVLASAVLFSLGWLLLGITSAAPPGCFFWSGLGALASLSAGVTNVVRFRPRVRPEAPAPKPAAATAQKLNRRQRRHGGKR